MIKVIRSNQWLFFPLFLSFLFFLRKGIQYAFLESYIPLVFIAVPLVFLAVSLGINKRFFFIIARIWGILIIGWSVLRLFIAITNYLFPTFDEYHLSSQFGILGSLLSVFILSLGVLIFRYARTKRIKNWG